MDYDLVAFVIRSKSRKLILLRLTEGPSTPSIISNSVGINRAHVSRALRELLEKDLVTCMTQSRKGRIYGISAKGKTVATEISHLNL